MKHRIFEENRHRHYLSVQTVLAIIGSLGRNHAFFPRSQPKKLPVQAKVHRFSKYVKILG